jgi:hypothetical protein
MRSLEDRHQSFTRTADATRTHLLRSTAMTHTKTHHHVDLKAGALERKRRRARALSANVVRRAMRARRSVVG